MEQYAWLLWVILGVILIVAEIFTLGFVLFWFGLGAFAAAIAAMLGVGIPGQFGIFALVSIGLTVMSRTIFAKYLWHQDEENPMKMGVDSLPGQIGTVTSGSSGALDEGAVRVYGSVWTAYPSDEDVKLIEGEKVEVVSVKGSSIYVKPVKKELPEWRND
jgi:membrane protein implicated in regulation of membrane protease activity